MANHSQSEDSDLSAPPIVPNGDDQVAMTNQWKETSADATPPAASVDDAPAAPRSKFTFHQKIILLSASITSLSVWASYAIIAVFFATEAEKKGMSKPVVGLVFSAYFIVISISSPVWGKILPFFGARFVFLAGAFITGGSNILLGFVEDMPTLATFTGFTFAIRIMEGLGSAACNTAMGAILAFTFADNVGMALSVTETFSGVSFALGPVIGGLLYNVGGFKLPFFVLGGFVCACVVLNYFLLPEIGKQHEDSGPMLEVLKLPAVWVVLLACAFSTLAFSALDPVLAIHLKTLGFSVLGTSLVFTSWGGGYGLTSVLWGYIVDKTGMTRSLMTIGAFTAVICFLLIGPAPFLNITPSAALIAVPTPIAGCVVAMIIIPSMPDILFTTRIYGISDTLGLTSVVSGLWFGSFSVGSVLGPIISGTLTEYYGFGYAFTAIAGGFLVVLIILCLLGLWEYRCGKGRRLTSRLVVEVGSTEEKETLLSNEA